MELSEKRRRFVFNELLEWAQSYDDRAVSDEAREWAETERGTAARPENDGEWLASMEAAFDAGRQYESLLRYHARSERAVEGE